MSKVTKIVAGVALIGLAFVAPASLKPHLITLGASLILGGVAEIIVGTPKLAQEQSGFKTVIANATDSQKYIYGTMLVGGTEVYAEEYSTGSVEVPNDTLVFARVIADKPIHGFGRVWLGETEITFNVQSGACETAPYVGKLWLKTYDGHQTQADPWLVASNSDFKSSFVGWGKAYYAVKAIYDPDVFPYGVSELRQMKIEVFGHELYNPLTGQTEFTNNAALVIYDYLTDTHIGGAVTNAEIDQATLEAAINECASDMVVKGGTIASPATIAKYTIDGIVDSSSSVPQNLRTMLTAMAGHHVYRGGKFYFYAGAPVFASKTLDEEDIVQISSGVKADASAGYNEVSGLFISPSHRFEAAEYPVLKNSTYLNEDGGEVRALQMSLPYTHDHRRAQRIAKIYLERSRKRMVQLTAFPVALECPAQTGVLLSWKNFNWSNEVFIVQSAILNTNFEEGLFVNLNLREEDPSIYDWSVADEQDLHETNKLRIGSPYVAASVKGLGVTPQIFTDGSGREFSQLFVTWDDPGFGVRQTIIEWKLSSETTWQTGVINNYSTEDAVEEVREIIDVPSESLIDVRVYHSMENSTKGPVFYKYNIQSLLAKNTTVLGEDLVDENNDVVAAIDIVADSSFKFHKRFHFVENGADDWTASNATLTFGAKTARFITTALDAKFISPLGLMINSDNTHVLVRMKRNSTGGSSLDYPQLFWKRTTDSGFSSTRGMKAKRHFPVGSWIVFPFDLEDHTEWNGTIDRLRFDPSNDAGADDFNFHWLAVGVPEATSGSTYNLLDAYAHTEAGYSNSSTDVPLVERLLSDMGLQAGDQISYGLDVLLNGTRTGRASLAVKNSGGTVIAEPAASTWVSQHTQQSKHMGYILPDGAHSVVLYGQRGSTGSGGVGFTNAVLVKSADISVPQHVAETIRNENQQWADVSGSGKPSDNADITDYANPLINNNQFQIDSNGNLRFYNGSGWINLGSVTLPGLGFSGDLDADRTAHNIAAGFLGQGPLATIDNATWETSNMTTARSIVNTGTASKTKLVNPTRVMGAPITVMWAPSIYCTKATTRTLQVRFFRHLPASSNYEVLVEEQHITVTNSPHYYPFIFNYRPTSLADAQSIYGLGIALTTDQGINEVVEVGASPLRLFEVAY